jgi:hypothetical protein
MDVEFELLGDDRNSRVLSRGAHRGLRSGLDVLLPESSQPRAADRVEGRLSQPVVRRGRSAVRVPFVAKEFT